MIPARRLGSTLPPERTTPTRAPRARGSRPVKTAAAATAPVGSTRSLARKRRNRAVFTMSSSETSRMSETWARRIGNVSSPGMRLRTPSASVGGGGIRVRSPFWKGRNVAFAVSGSTPKTSIAGDRVFAATQHPATRPFLRVERQQPVEGASDLERSRALLVLALEEDALAGRVVERAAGDDGGPVHAVHEPPRCGLHPVERQHALPPSSGAEGLVGGGALERRRVDHERPQGRGSDRFHAVGDAGREEAGRARPALADLARHLDPGTAVQDVHRLLDLVGVALGHPAGLHDAEYHLHRLGPVDGTPDETAVHGAGMERWGVGGGPIGGVEAAGAGPPPTTPPPPRCPPSP